MRLRNIDTQFEKQILTGMIISDKFLQQVTAIYSEDYLDSKIAKLVAGWCLSYFERYEKAPQEHIGDLYQQYVRKNDIDDKEKVFIETLLEGLSEEYIRADKFNVEYLLDIAEKEFDKKNLKMVSDDLRIHIQNGDVDKAKQLFDSYKPVELPKTKGICPFSDKEAIEKAFQSAGESLFTLPGRIGQIMNPQFVRDSFIGFMAQEKGGKSFWLQELAFRAYRDRCNVALFDTGDMTQDQKIRRIHTYLSGKPVKKKNRQTLLPVVDCIKNRTNDCDECMSTVDYEDYKIEEIDDYILYLERMKKKGYKPCDKCYKEGKKFKGIVYHESVKELEPLNWEESLKEGLRWTRRMKGKRFKLSCHESGTLTVKGAKRILENWEKYEGFIPDVIIFDYADVMGVEDTNKEFRHQENDRWKAMRALSQNKHCCVITASQADAGSYGKESLTKKNFSEDKRKYAHVTAFYAINQTDKEKELGVMRIGELVVREEDYNSSRRITILQCLDMGRPLLHSF